MNLQYKYVYKGLQDSFTHILTSPPREIVDILSLFHLHEDFHSVQRGGAGARDGPRHRTCDELLPPAAWALLFLCEFIWDGKTVTYVQHLVITHIYSVTFVYGQIEVRQHNCSCQSHKHINSVVCQFMTIINTVRCLWECVSLRKVRVVSASPFEVYFHTLFSQWCSSFVCQITSCTLERGQHLQNLDCKVSVSKWTR